MTTEQDDLAKTIADIKVNLAKRGKRYQDYLVGRGVVED